MDTKHRCNNLKLIFAVLALICCTTTLSKPAWAGDVSDACTAKVPKPLIDILMRKFKGYRLPRVADQSNEDIALSERFGGDSCLAIASGDFGGHRKNDFAILLTNENRTKVRLIAALSIGTSWSIYELPTWCNAASRCYVQVKKPGIYQRTESLSSPIVDPKEKDMLASKHENILSGTLEATGVVYVFQKNSWHYVWISD